MRPSLALLTLVPLLAVEPALSSAESAHDRFPDQQLMDQLRQAQDYAMQAGQDLAHSLAILQQALPRYGMPYLDAHGNIVIPRLEPAPQGTLVPEAGPGAL